MRIRASRSPATAAADDDSEDGSGSAPPFLTFMGPAFRIAIDRPAAGTDLRYHPRTRPGHNAVAAVSISKNRSTARSRSSRSISALSIAAETVVSSHPPACRPRSEATSTPPANSLAPTSCRAPAVTPHPQQLVRPGDGKPQTQQRKPLAHHVPFSRAARPPRLLANRLGPPAPATR